MLEFIVLGQVPGTNIHLSFTAISILLLMTPFTVKGIRKLKLYLAKHKQQTRIEAHSI